MSIFNLPDLGEGLAEAEIREWYVNEGDIVKVDQPLVSMETAKAVVDVPSPYAGKILKLHGKASDIIKTGSPLITYEADGMNVQPDKSKGSVVGSLEESQETWKEESVLLSATNTTRTIAKAMPAARVLATEMGVDLSQIKGSGPQGLITVSDVKASINQSGNQSSTQSSSAIMHLLEGGDKQSLRGLRRTMALSMVQSHHEIVPVTLFDEVDISHLGSGKDITVQLLRAMVYAAEKEPALNALFDGKALEKHLYKTVNVGLAVDTEEGLIVPVIHDVAAQSDDALRKQINQYKQESRDRSLSTKSLQGATITLSNFGTFAGRYATPIIVPPTIAILGAGRMRDAAVVKSGAIVPGRVLPLSLTFDHRAATGGEATRYLAGIIAYFASLTG